ncbi:hypothetical protein IJS18_01645 [Candidatus Saccharibacteria bacterium]|nr:hypothetical protein [Candidatus Saccharibacteria bacterium]
MQDSLGLTHNNLEAGRKIREYPYNFILAGRYYGGSAAGRNTFTAHMAKSNGLYTRNASILSLNLTNGARWYNIETAKWNGYPVRCYAATSN